MIIYFSGGGVNGVWRPVNELLIRNDCARLLSFAYKKLIFDYCELAKNMQTKVRLMVDSGAFSAWSKGDVIDREELSEVFYTVLTKYSDYIDPVLINLDVIPGTKGVDPTPKELLECMDMSVVNFDYLNEKFPGLVLPVFHQGEPGTFLELLADSADYLCLSPRNDVGEKWRTQWARSVHNDSGRFHGLAATGVEMMETVNWESVDSAGWVMVGGMGSIFWPTASSIKSISVSAESNSNKEFGKHIKSMTDPERNTILQTLSSKGFDIDLLAISDTERYKWNATVWMEYEPKNRIRYERGLFDA